MVCVGRCVGVVAAIGADKDVPRVVEKLALVGFGVVIGDVDAAVDEVGEVVGGWDVAVLEISF